MCAFSSTHNSQYYIMARLKSNRGAPRGINLLSPVAGAGAGAAAALTSPAKKKQQELREQQPPPLSRAITKVWDGRKFGTGLTHGA